MMPRKPDLKKLEKIKHSTRTELKIKRLMINSVTHMMKLQVMTISKTVREKLKIKKIRMMMMITR